MTQEQLTDFRPDPNNLNKGTERGIMRWSGAFVSTALLDRSLLTRRA